MSTNILTNDRNILWIPSTDRIQASSMWKFKSYVEMRYGTVLGGYSALQSWSAENLSSFWASVWDYCDVVASTQPESVLAKESMPGAEWFPGAQLNYAENFLRRAQVAPDEVAVIGEHESLPTTTLTWRELERQTAALAAQLRHLGVRSGDRVVGFLPHVPETLISMLAAASIGATWSVVNTDFGTDGVLDRFEQLQPTVFITIDGYDFNEKLHDVTERAAEIAAALPTVEHIIVVDQYRDTIEPTLPEGYVTFSELTAQPARPQYEQVPFDHPLWILYSSGTTGKPKGIVHSHGGILIEGLKSNVLHYDIRPGDVVYYAVSTTWAVWNMVVNTMLAGATVVTYDGAPSVGQRSRHLQVVAKHGVSMFGCGAAVLEMTQNDDGWAHGGYDLTSLRTIMITGSPLPETTWRWIYDELKLDVMLCSESGGTEVATAFVGANPLDAVRLGESMGASLGVAAATWAESGERVWDSVGELVITRPMPSMPIYLYGDDKNERYRSTYFEYFPGVWRQGDWATEYTGGGFVIHGRSDATINRGGIRMGSSDITQVVNELNFIKESLVIGAELGNGEYYMPLFVVLTQGDDLSQDQIQQIKGTIRERISPRYVPDAITAAPDIPKTRTGKAMEVPVKRLFQGASVRDINISSASNPEIVKWYSKQAREFREGLPLHGYSCMKPL